MKGAEAYINDQWQTCGLAELPRGDEALDVTLRLMIPRQEQFTALFEQIRELGLTHLREAYPDREVSAEPVLGSQLGDGSGDFIEVHYRIAARPEGGR